MARQSKLQRRLQQRLRNWAQISVGVAFAAMVPADPPFGAAIKLIGVFLILIGGYCEYDSIFN